MESTDALTSHDHQPRAVASLVGVAGIWRRALARDNKKGPVCAPGGQNGRPAYRQHLISLEVNNMEKVYDETLESGAILACDDHCMCTW